MCLDPAATGSMIMGIMMIMDYGGYRGCVKVTRNVYRLSLSELKRDLRVAAYFQRYYFVRFKC